MVLMDTDIVKDHAFMKAREISGYSPLVWR